MGIKRLHMSPLIKKEIVSEINDNEEFTKVIVPINLNKIDNINGKTLAYCLNMKRSRTKVSFLWRS